MRILTSMAMLVTLLIAAPSGNASLIRVDFEGTVKTIRGDAARETFALGTLVRGSVVIDSVVSTDANPDPFVGSYRDTGSGSPIFDFRLTIGDFEYARNGPSDAEYVSVHNRRSLTEFPFGDSLVARGNIDGRAIGGHVPDVAQFAAAQTRGRDRRRDPLTSDAIPTAEELAMLPQLDDRAGRVASINFLTFEGSDNRVDWRIDSFTAREIERPIPEPSSALPFALGFVALGAGSRRSRRAPPH